MRNEQWIHARGSYAIVFLLAKLEVNVFKAILSILRFLNLTEYREVIAKRSLFITHTLRNVDLDLVLVTVLNSMEVRLTWRDCQR